MTTTTRITLLSILALPVFHSAPAMSATEFEDSIPIDLARLFLTQPFNGESAIYTDLPDDFPQFDVPAVFELLGSVVDDNSQRVYLRTQSGRLAAGEAIRDVFSTDWSEIINARMGDAAQRGFVSRVPFSLPRQLCHDDYGTMSVSANDLEDGTLILLTIRNRRQQQAVDCEELQRMSQRPGFGLTVGVIEHMPRLELPEPLDDRNGYGIMPGGAGGSVNDAESRTSITIDWPVSELHAHFEEQLLEQDWTLDTSTVSEQLAVSGWMKSAEEENDLYGTFTILHLGDNTYQMKFQLIRKNTGQAPVAGRIVEVF